MIRSLRAAVLLSILMLLPVLTLSSSQLGAVYGIALSVTLLPALLVMTTLWGGLLPALVGLAGALVMVFLPLGPDAALLMALYLLPVMAALLICVQNRKPFFQTALWLTAAELAGGFAALLILNSRVNGGLGPGLAEQIAGLIRTSGMQDEILVVMLQSGLARLDSSLYGQIQGLTGGLSEVGREELLLSLTSTLTDILQMLPVMLISGAIWHSLAGLGFGIYFGRRSLIRQVVDRRRSELMQKVLEQRRIQMEQGEVPNPVRLESREQLMRELQADCEEALGDFPSLQMPSLALWHMPRGVGLMAALPGLGYVAALLSDAPQVALVGRMLGAIFTAMYTIQGIAVLNFILGRTGRGLLFRSVIIGFAVLILSRALLFLGVLEQLADFRKLRQKPGENRPDRS